VTTPPQGGRGGWHYSVAVLARILIFIALAAILGVPFALRPSTREATDRDALTLIIVTPHVQQIRSEFAAAFDQWHRRHYGHSVRIDWRTPGGTSEIVKQLQAQYAAAAKSGRFDFASPGHPAAAPEAIGFDLMFGGGSYDHGRLKRGIVVSVGGVEQRIAISTPPRPQAFAPAQLDEWYRENRIGSELLYDPEQHWFGAALSSFGIVYNRQIVAQLGLPEPRTFEDLADPRYMGWLALADPRQSGSITTALDSILNNEGWERGWRILREMTANSRSFTSSATRPPIDVSAGEAAAGLAIDFYGRGQAQSITRPGERSRVGYIDPPGRVYVDADPISILRGGPNPLLARRFVEFCLSEEGQALWQFPALASRSEGGAAGNPQNEMGEPMGPQRHQLRRMPVRRLMYQKHLSHFIDQVNPFDIASETSVRGWRGAIGPMMGAFAIDIADEQRAAWAALNRARSTPGFPAEQLAEMERLFYAWPPHTMPDGTALEFNESNIERILVSWRDADLLARARIDYTKFFRASYRRIQELAGATPAGSG
jgi:iron(III) transport system substrate-binding protein